MTTVQTKNSLLPTFFIMSSLCNCQEGVGVFLVEPKGTVWSLLGNKDSDHTSMISGPF